MPSYICVYIYIYMCVCVCVCSWLAQTKSCLHSLEPAAQARVVAELLEQPHLRVAAVARCLFMGGASLHQVGTSVAKGSCYTSYVNIIKLL